MNITLAKKETMKKHLSDIALDVSWAKISQKYFGKSASWIYNKINGIDGNGGEGGFTEAEKQQLKTALYDFADRLRATANKIN